MFCKVLVLAGMACASLSAMDPLKEQAPEKPAAVSAPMPKMASAVSEQSTLLPCAQDMISVPSSTTPPQPPPPFVHITALEMLYSDVGQDVDGVAGDCTPQ